MLSLGSDVHNLTNTIFLSLVCAQYFLQFCYFGDLKLSINFVVFFLSGRKQVKKNSFVTDDCICSLEAVIDSASSLCFLFVSTRRSVSKNACTYRGGTEHNHRSGLPRQTTTVHTCRKRQALLMWTHIASIFSETSHLHSVSLACRNFITHLEQNTHAHRTTHAPLRTDKYNVQVCGPYQGIAKN